jgi:hypothetical protein
MDIATKYAFSRQGSFWPDIISVIPLVTLGKGKLNALHLTRLYSLGIALSPLTLLVKCVMPNAKAFELAAWSNLVTFIVMFMLLAHCVSCVFIYIGYIDRDLPEEDRHSWLTVPDNQFEGKSWHYIYSFAYYWLFEVIATVGYGEFTGTTPLEYWVTIFFEFLGVTFIALLLGFLGKAIGHDVTFDGFITERLDVIDTWALKLEKSNQPKFLHTKLYSGITSNVENAMMYDFNLIIEEFEFYQRLKPRMQTELIDTVFIDFQEKFWKFFKLCQVGFRNEFIISMLCRLYRTDDIIMNIGDKVRYVYFLHEGACTLYNNKKIAQISLQPGSWFGDVHVLFGLKCNYMIKSEPIQTDIQAFMAYKLWNTTGLK